MPPAKAAADVPQRSIAASSMTEWETHIQALGLSSVDEYRRWCRRHGFGFHRKKTWRQEREELRVAAAERDDRAAQDHIRSLGLEETEAYLAWCSRHGFRPSLDKKPRQRYKEIQLAARLNAAAADAPPTPAPPPAKKKKPLDRQQALSLLAGAKRQGQRRRPLIRRICTGQTTEAELDSLLLRLIHAGSLDLDEAGRAALGELLLHVEANADLLGLDPGVSCWVRRPGNTLIEGLIALAKHHAAWIRPPTAWRTAERQRQRQFGALVRHLLARYEVPAWLDAVFFRNDGEALRQQGWFIHVGTGGNLRTADLPLRLTKKMAHHAFQAPAASTPEQALRYGQVLGLGGTPAQAQAVNATRLGGDFSKDDFWREVVRFLLRHGQLATSQYGPIVDYIHHRKYDAADGEPAEPNFSMKSRSLPKLLRQVEKWQDRFKDAAELPTTAAHYTKSNFSYLYHQETDPDTGRVLHWTVQELKTARALANEGEAMRHCVGEYSSKLRDTAIWSIQVREGETTRRVMTVAIDNKTDAITQMRGRFNADPDNEVDARGHALADPVRAKGRLNRADRDYLRRANAVLRLWMQREGVTFARPRAD